MTRQVALPVAYKSIRLDCGDRLNIVVDATIVVEIKSVGRLLPVRDAQLLTYLRLSRCPVGVILNFHAATLTHGLRRPAL